jgi:hypothetical protein
LFKSVDFLFKRFNRDWQESENEKQIFLKVYVKEKKMYEDLQLELA